MNPLDQMRDPSATDWNRVRQHLGIPYGWRLRPIAGKGNWRLRAEAGAKSNSLPCGHRSIQVTSATLPLAVARLAQMVRFHKDELR